MFSLKPPFQIFRKEGLFAEVVKEFTWFNKEFFSFTDVYGVEIDEDEDVVSILATCIVIDQLPHDGND
jgi:uncharacterized protein YxjI